MQRAALFAALLLAMLVDGFFALVNFYPVAPTRSRGPQRFVYAELDPSQARWLQANVLDAFNEERNLNVQLRVVESERLLPALAAARGAGGSPVLLAVLPTEVAAEAVRQRAVRAFDDVVPLAALQGDLADVRPEVMRGAQVAGRQWFLPRMTVLDVGVYRVSRVRDAEEHWELARPQIEAALRAVNGRGLPAGYQFEHDPMRWDSYDQFVLAFYWAHRSYDGQPARPRVAHRTGQSADGVFDVAAGIYRMGGTDATLGRYDSPAARDYFAWEALYRRHGLYAPEMFAAGGLDDEGVRAGLERGSLFLSDVDQMEAFTLHGGSHRGTPARVDDPGDLDFVALPGGASLALDARGQPARHAQGFSFREEAVWALPAGGADPLVAYDLVRFMLTRANHYRECEALGMLPLRTDVVRERASIFRLAWMEDVFEAGFAQWPRSELVPTALTQGGHGQRYAALWDRVVAGDAGDPAQPEALAALLREPPPAPANAPGDAPGDAPGEAPGRVPAPAPAPPDPGAADDGDDREAAAGHVNVGDWRARVVLQWDDAGAASDGAGDAAGAAR